MANIATIILVSDETKKKGYEKKILKKMNDLGYKYITNHNRIGNYFLNKKENKEICCIDFGEHYISFVSKYVIDYTPLIEMFKYIDFTNNIITNEIEGEGLDMFYIISDMEEYIDNKTKKSLDQLIMKYYSFLDTIPITLIYKNNKVEILKGEEESYLNKIKKKLYTIIEDSKEIFINYNSLLDINIKTVTKNIISQYYSNIAKEKEMKEKENILINIINEEVQKIKSLNKLEHFGNNLSLLILDKDNNIEEDKLEYLMRQINTNYYGVLIASLLPTDSRFTIKKEL